MPTDSYSDETALLLDAIRQVREHFYNNAGAGKLAPYKHIEVRDNVHISFAPYYQMLEDHAQSLANEVNSFGYHTGQLEAWSVVLPKYEIEDQLLLLMEFVEPIATTAVGAPYALRSRFLFSVSHLCHQANKFARTGWNEAKLPVDGSINYKTMLSAGEGWKQFNLFRESLDQLFDQNYESSTSGFRHKYQHRFPPRFQHGQTETVSRSIDKQSKGVSYGFGYTEPLQLASLAPVLRAKHAIALEAFGGYSELLREHIVAIHSK